MYNALIFRLQQVLEDIEDIKESVVGDRDRALFPRSTKSSKLYVLCLFAQHNLLILGNK